MSTDRVAPFPPRRVRDLMTRTPLTVEPDDSLTSVWNLMASSDVRHLPVVREGRLVGLVTQRDLLAADLSPLTEPACNEAHHLRNEVQVEKIMCRRPITIGPDDLLLRAGTMMLERRIGCLPVVESGQLVGILTDADLARLALALLRAQTAPALHPE